MTHYPTIGLLEIVSLSAEYNIYDKTDTITARQ